MNIWTEISTAEKAKLVATSTSEMLRSLTPHQRDCMFKVHMQQACREPVDTAAERIVQDAVDAFNKQWKTRTEAEWVARKERRGILVRVGGLGR
ncbi:MAG: hypothetical protein HY287_12225 [Planctomycetes bacterium]|nr:hypothetical protein [Planctomycetota bacterium]MBI3835087.1 hypothetical protein [Planctomycetota bacterium]